MVAEKEPAPNAETSTEDEAKPKPESTRALTLGLIVSASLYMLIRYVLLADDPLTPQTYWLGLKVTGWPDKLQGYLLPFDVCLTGLGLLLTNKTLFAWRRKARASKVNSPVRFLLYISLVFVFGFGISCLLLPGVFGWLTTIELGLYAGLIMWGILIGLLLVAVGLYCLGHLVQQISRGLSLAFKRRRAKMSGTKQLGTGKRPSITRPVGRTSDRDNK